MQSVGIDIVEIDRIARLYEKYGKRFSNRLLGERERHLFEERCGSVAFLAGRFAVKEALIKALGEHLSQRPSLASLQVEPGERGRPRVVWPDYLGDIMRGLDCAVSISHERQSAVAIAIISEKR